MASTVWKGYITFGLISIPIRLFAAARSQHVSFHQVHAVCNTRIKQQLYCPTCERVVDRSEIVKGYEVDKTHIVQITDEEVKKVEPRSTDTMEITEFESSFYSVPEDPGKKAYHLLRETMEKLGVCGVGESG